MMSPLREKGISKQGYLTKAPFHGENNGTPGAKVLNSPVVILVFPFKYPIGCWRQGGGRRNAPPVQHKLYVAGMWCC